MLMALLKQFVKQKPHALARLMQQEVNANLHTPKKEPSKRKTKTKKNSQKRQRLSTPRKAHDERKNLGDVLIPLVDEFIRPDSNIKKFYKRSADAGNYFDAAEFEPYANTAVQLTMGLVSPQKMMKSFQLCKSFIKSRRQYLKGK